MSHRAKNHVGQFTARDEEGNEFVIHIYKTTVQINARQGTFDAPTGMKLQTADGRAVNCWSRGNYEIVDLPTVPLTSSDPAAFDPDSL